MERLGVVFVSVVAANLLSAFIIATALRLYIHWSVQDSAENFRTQMKQVQSPKHETR